MKRTLGSWFQRNAHSPFRRAYFWLLRHVLGVFGKSQQVYFMNINGHPFKRVVFLDTRLAAEVEHNLLQFSNERMFPTLIHRHENELLLDFVKGDAFNPEEFRHRQAFLQFMQSLYKRGREETVVDSGPSMRQLTIDLDFLVRCGVLQSELQASLLSAAQAVTPETLALGWDYVDPVRKNFIIQSDQLMAIDVESLAHGEPVGSGLVAATLHWLSNEQLFELLSEIDAESRDLVLQLPFLAIAYPVGWCKRKILQGKRNFVPRARLETRGELARQLASYSSNH